MGAIRIRVGASLDSNALTVFQPLEKAAERARKNIQASLAGAGKAASQGMKSGAKDAEAAFDKLADEVSGRGRAMMAPGTRAIADFAREARSNFDDIKKGFGQLATQAEKDIARIEKAPKAGRGGRLGGGAGGGADRFIGQAASFGRRAGSELLRGYGVETSFASLMQGNVGLEASAVNLANAGFMNGEKGPNGQRQNPADIIAEVRRTATDTAFDPTKAMEGLQAFVGKTGDLATGRDILKDMAVLSKATGTSLEDMVNAAGDVSNSLGDVPNKGEAIGRVMRSIAGQGKLGAVEISDMAVQMAKLAAAAPQFQGKVEDNIAMLGALAQEARQRGGASSATMAATSVGAFVNTLKTPARAAQFKAAGIGIEKNGFLRNPEEIILDALQKVGGSTDKFKKLFSNVQGARAVEGFRSIYLQAGGGQGSKEGDDRGLAAVVEEFDRLKRAAIGQGEVLESFKNAMGTTQSQVQVLNNQLSALAETVAGAVNSALKEFGPALSELAGLAKGAGFGLSQAMHVLTGDDEADKQRQDYALTSAARNSAAKSSALADDLAKAAEPLYKTDQWGNVQRYSNSIESGKVTQGRLQERALSTAVDEEAARFAEQRKTAFSIPGVNSDTDALFFAQKQPSDNIEKAQQEQVKQYLESRKAFEEHKAILEKIHATNQQLTDAIKSGITVLVESKGTQADGSGQAPPNSPIPVKK